MPAISTLRASGKKEAAAKRISTPSANFSPLGIGKKFFPRLISRPLWLAALWQATRSIRGRSGSSKRWAHSLKMPLNRASAHWVEPASAPNGPKIAEALTSALLEPIGRTEIETPDPSIEAIPSETTLESSHA